ncbi:MAG TPA: hypothetical protein VHR66_12645, partial [Gemmataceae bacterium]|nr:hypothetical protein [Gemmataceae bacterium]
MDGQPPLQHGLDVFHTAQEANRALRRQVEGAVRHVVGERLDCAGMRWIPGRAQALLHRRCIELNGDWPEFIAWTARAHQALLVAREAVQICTNQALDCR